MHTRIYTLVGSQPKERLVGRLAPRSLAASIKVVILHDIFLLRNVRWCLRSPKPVYFCAGLTSQPVCSKTEVVQCFPRGLIDFLWAK